MTNYTEGSTQAVVAAGQTPANPTAIRYADGSFIGVRAATFFNSYREAP